MQTPVYKKGSIASEILTSQHSPSPSYADPWSYRRPPRKSHSASEAPTQATPEPEPTHRIAITMRYTSFALVASLAAYAMATPIRYGTAMPVNATTSDNSVANLNTGVLPVELEEMPVVAARANIVIEASPINAGVLPAEAEALPAIVTRDDDSIDVTDTLSAEEAADILATVQVEQAANAEDALPATVVVGNIVYVLSEDHLSYQDIDALLPVVEVGHVASHAAPANTTDDSGDKNILSRQGPDFVNGPDGELDTATDIGRRDLGTPRRKDLDAILAGEENVVIKDAGIMMFGPEMFEAEAIPEGPVE